MRLTALIVFVLATAASFSACDDTPTTPSAPAAPTAATERFDAIIDPKGLNYFAFGVTQSGLPTTVNLASLAPLDRPGVVDVNMQIGLGTTIRDDGNNLIGCERRTTIDTRPGLSAQLSDMLTPAANYCATIADIGNLKESVNFSLRVSHP